MYWYFDAFKHYATFTGVAPRRAFWMFMLVNLVISSIIMAFEIITRNPSWIDGLYSLITLLPFLALLVRRLRDTGLSLWSLLVLLIPGVGMIVMTYFLCLPSQPRSQQLSGGENL